MGTVAIPDISSEITEALHARYAVKKYDSARIVADENLDTLLKSIELAPSSYGLQPIKALVITDPELRARLRPAAWGQPQITDASHLIVFLARKSVREDDVDSYVDRIASIRKVGTESLAGLREMISTKIVKADQSNIAQWTARQAYIALGFLLSTAAMLRIDSTPMEGFDPKQFDSILGIDQSEWTSVVLCAVGYRDERDSLASQRKVRKTREELIEFL